MAEIWVQLQIQLLVGCKFNRREAFPFSKIMIMDISSYCGAMFSECRKYRYCLYRTWKPGTPVLIVIGLNPSSADERTDDPTIKRVCAIAKNNGYGGILMFNLFALITPNPVDLVNHADPVNENDQWLAGLRGHKGDIVFAWGNFKMARERAKKVIDMYPDAYALCINKNGSPKHPLYCRADSKLIKFNQTD